MTKKTLIIICNIFTLFLLFVSCEKQTIATNNDTLVIGTFNMEWLGDGEADTKLRNKKDYMEIADIIQTSGMEVIGVQEVENEYALSRVVEYLKGYKFKVSKQKNKQRVGIIYKNYIKLSSISEYEPLSIDGKYRDGYVVDISKNNYSMKMMVVHLKSTSRYDSTEEMKQQSREIRHTQSKIISYWADSLMSECGVKELAIVGDFNDYPTRKNNQTLQYIIENPNLHFLSSGIRSCENSLWFSIDHIVVSSYTKQRYVSNSVFVYDFHSKLDNNEADGISDHCPISVELQIK
jgi:endonuclease/exonuclease/phosphatase family metal-dependent hydrolase